MNGSCGPVVAYCPQLHPIFYSPVSSKAEHNLPFRTSSTTTLPRLRLRHPNNDDDDDDCRAQEVAKNRRNSNDPRNGAPGRDTDRTQMGLPDLAHHTSTIVAAVGAVLSRSASVRHIPTTRHSQGIRVNNEVELPSKHARPRRAFNPSSPHLSQFLPKHIQVASESIGA